MARKKITSENANEMREKGLIKRKAMSEVNTWIDENYKTIVAFATGRIPYESFIAEMSPMERAYIEGIKDPDPQKAMAACERILDRIKGRPKQAVDANVQSDVKYVLKFGE